VSPLVRAHAEAVRRYAERTFLALDPGPRALFYENFAVFGQALQQRLLADPDLATARDPYAEELRCYEEGEGGTLERMSRADLQTYLVELLMKQDQMSMAASIESRSLSGPRAGRTRRRHPGHFKLQGWRSKAVLREALRDVIPREILTRRRWGFPCP